MKVTLVCGGDIKLVQVARVIIERRRQTDASSVTSHYDWNVSVSSSVDDRRPIPVLTALNVHTTRICRPHLHNISHDIFNKCFFKKRSL